MKAVRIHAYGGSEVLSYEEAPMPVVGDDDALIREIGRRGIAVFDGKEAGGGELFPDGPGRAEPVGTFGMVQNGAGRAVKPACVWRVVHGGAENNTSCLTD